MLTVEIGIGNGDTQNVVILAGDTPESLAEEFSLDFNLKNDMKERI